MKFLFAFSLLFLTVPAFAKEGFYCIPSMRSTWIAVEKNADVVTLAVKNPMGYEYMPQFDGPMAPATIPFQKMQFDDLKKLGDSFVFEWPAKNCELSSAEKTVFCSGSANKRIASIEAFGLSSIQITEKYKDETIQKNRYRLVFEKEGNTYFVSLDFFNSTCENLK